MGWRKIKTELNKEYKEDNIGESWEISDVSGDETVVAEGSLKGNTLRDLTMEFKGDFVGEAVYEKFGEEFPLLIKFIDAKTLYLFRCILVMKSQKYVIIHLVKMKCGM